MNAKRAGAALLASVALPLASLGAGGCGDEDSKPAPASQEQIQQEVNEALDLSEQSKRAREEAADDAARAEENLDDALEQAQEETEENDNPSY